MPSAFVIAHYDPQGRIRLHLRRLVDTLLQTPARVVFVSTGVDDGELASLPAAVERIKRPNVGYDFESYHVGIEALGGRGALDQIVLLNDSFISFQPAKLRDVALAMARSGADVAGLTASREEAFHLQTYFVSFCGRAVLDGEAFRRFWDEEGAHPLSDREQVIRAYEIGMTQHFLRAGCRLAAAYAPDAVMRFRAICRWAETHELPPDAYAGGRVTLDLREADNLNATHFFWDDVLRRFGIVKRDLLRANRHQVNLEPFHALMRADAGLRLLYEDAFAP